MVNVLYLSKRDFLKPITDVLNSQKDINMIDCLHYSDGIDEEIVGLSPKIVLFDVDDIPWNDIVSTVKYVKKASNIIRIIVITTTIDDIHLLHAIQVGIDTLLLKRSRMEDSLIHSIHHVIHDRFILPSKTTKALIDRVLDLKINNIGLFHHRLHENDINLTLREAEIAYLMKQGLKNKVIAHKMQLNEGTVKVHISHIYQKLNIKGRKNVVKLLNEIMIPQRKGTYESIM